MVEPRASGPRAEPRNRYTTRALFAALIGLALGIVACRVSQRAPAIAPQAMVILSGGRNGLALGSAIASVWNTSVPNVHVTSTSTGSQASTLRQFESGTGELAFASADAAYAAYRGVASHDAAREEIRAITLISVSLVHLVARCDAHVKNIEDIRNRRVAIGSQPGGGTTIRAVLESNGLELQRLHAESMLPDEVLARMKSGSVDVAAWPSVVPSITMDVLNAASPMCLVPIETAKADRIRSEFPFFKPAVIPKNTYPYQPDDVPTIGSDIVLVCRASMSEQLAYTLTKAYFDGAPELRKHVNAPLIDADHAAATPVPLHPGAARFFRERQLFR